MLRDLFDTDGQFNSAHWVVLSDWSGLTWTAVGLLVCILIGFSWWNTQPLNRMRRITLLALRTATLVVITFLFIQPGIRLEHRNIVRNHVAVLIDQSRSMLLPGQSSGSRLDQLKRYLEANLAVFKSWQTEHQVDYFTFGRYVKAVDDLKSIQALGEMTDLAGALDDVQSRYTSGDLAAVIILSDGTDTTKLKEISDPSLIPNRVQIAIKKLNAPVHTVFIGPDKVAPDLAIQDLSYDEFAFVRNAVTIDAKVSVFGYEQLRIPVTMKRNGKELGRQVLEVVPGKQNYEFSFEFVPDETGKSSFTFEVGSAPGEQIVINNRREFVIRVIRDKIRVLQVVGRPSWDERFLRKLLKKNPNVDLISFFILRTSSSLQVARRNEMSLIPFPTQELFEQQLGSFDLIIFQNFTYRGYQMRQYMPLIKRYVQNGGGFVMVGGDISFANGGYAGTPIAEFLPVTLRGGQLGGGEKSDYRPTLTPAGQFHPITNLKLSRDENQTAWQSLPMLSGLNQVAGLAPDSVVLLEHPTKRVGVKKSPVVAVRNFGKGRVLSVLTDSTWRWDFEAFGLGADNRNYYKFWGNAIRWLIRDPDLKTIRVTTGKDRYAVGDQVSVTVRLQADDYRPAIDQPVRVEVGKRHNEQTSTEAPIIRQGKTDKGGLFTFSVPIKTDGVWRVVARSGEDQELVDQDVFVVTSEPIELATTKTNPLLLKSISSIGQGRFLDDGDDLADLERKPPLLLQVNRRKDVPLWASAWLLLLAIILPSTEWFLRRRWGLL
ncbi:MAG: glutamine amidotransferase [Myxococcota bacterium]|nr:glutamine amidotransferase [Myxococcota bacterium]